MRRRLLPILALSLWPLSLPGQTPAASPDTAGFATYRRALSAATTAYYRRTAPEPWVFALDTISPPPALAALHDSVRIAAHALLISERRWNQYIGRIPGTCSEGRYTIGCGDPARALSTDGKFLRLQFAKDRERFDRTVIALRRRLSANLSAHV